jgi:serine/threonine protein kinase
MTELGTAGTKLSFLTPRGEEGTAMVDTAGAATTYGGYLRSWEVRLSGDVTDEPLLLVSFDQGLGRRQQLAAYRQLDSEILAGLRLARLAGAAESGACSDLVTQLVGYQPAGAGEFVLLRPLAGSAVSSYLGRLSSEDRRRFVDQLFLALRWLSAAGLVHRGLSPSTVRWTADSRVLVTHLFTSTLIGSPREAVGSAPWAAPEQRGSTGVPGLGGTVTDRDDVWALARLAVAVLNGFSTDDPAELDRLQLLDLFENAFADPDQRPTPMELLHRRGLADPLRLVAVENEGLRRGRERFDRLTGYRPPASSSDPVAGPEVSSGSVVSGEGSRHGKGAAAGPSLAAWLRGWWRGRGGRQ